MEEGWSEQEIKWRIRTGRLHRVHAGVYAVGHQVLSKQGLWMAAVLASGPDALLSHPDERMTEEGIPVTSVHRTIYDLAATVSVDDVIAMIKEAEYRRHYDRFSLPDLLERYPGKRGSRKVQLALQRITEEPSGRKRSKLEERFAPFLQRYRLPLPRFNDLISLNGKNYEVDATGRTAARSLSWMASRAAAPARPSRTIAPETGRSKSRATR
jgi:hypothetical protein